VYVPAVAYRCDGADIVVEVISSTPLLSKSHRYVYGVAPPDTVAVNATGVVILVEVGVADNETVNGVIVPDTVNVNDCVTIACPSVTLTTTVYVPTAAVGYEITPAGDTVMPAGFPDSEYDNTSLSASDAITVCTYELPDVIVELTSGITIGAVFLTVVESLPRDSS
jgi:hypothetical protein